jgi:protein PsiE
LLTTEFTKQLHWTTVVSEKGMLAVIGCLTLVAAGLDIWEMFLARNIDLADLFLLFIYVEIIGMVGAYYSTHVIPVTFPIVIAITAMCRLLILQGKESEPWVLIASAGAIIILAGAVYILNIGKKA